MLRDVEREPLVAVAVQRVADVLGELRHRVGSGGVAEAQPVDVVAVGEPGCAQGGVLVL